MRCRANKMRTILEEGAVFLKQVAETSPPPSTPRDSRRLREETSIWPSMLDLRKALRTPTHKKKASGRSHEDRKVTTSVHGSRAAEESESADSRLEGGGRKKECIWYKTPPNVKPTKIKRRELKHAESCQLSSSELSRWIRVLNVRW